MIEARDDRRHLANEAALIKHGGTPLFPMPFISGSTTRCLNAAKETPQMAKIITRIWTTPGPTGKRVRHVSYG